ncbi:MAG: hypothetical protein NC928_05130 [Candidatus Omnitrophica bacterium]|nr:hypothetical protein [Candidatus Omnitrophota bacterium]MCM8796044.1 hypothetical protein [Candidatus Omnitrophota bacterium]
MKLTPIIFLSVLTLVLGFKVYFLKKELLSAREDTAFYEKRSEDLQRELMRLNRRYTEREQFLNKIKQEITELENKIKLNSLQRYIPRNTWSEIEPLIDRLKAFSGEREETKSSAEDKKNF